MICEAPELQKTDLPADQPLTVCFVCTGNTCRSPMAQAWLTAHHGDRKIRVLSAGLAAVPGQPISRNAVLALQAAGVENTPDNPYESHTAVPLDALTVLSCDRIIGMTDAHAMQILLRYPEAASKICAMPHAIPDPYGGDEAAYRDCLSAIAQGIEEMFPQ